MDIDTHELARRFGDVFSGMAPSVIARAPGRVNLIGEHTDYNEGLVLPVAIEQATCVAAAARTDSLLVAYSALLGEANCIDRPPLQSPPVGRAEWHSYVRGVAALLDEAGIAVPGASLYIHSNIPLGAGLSSSAALEVGVAVALLALTGATMAPERIAALCREAEHRFAGTPCGLMDQFACLLSREGHALLLDCRDGRFRHVEFPVQHLELLIIDTQVKHELSEGEYAKRVADCRSGVERLRECRPDIRSLRDVTPDDLERFGPRLGEAILKRCRHVVEENGRVQAFVDALRRSNLAQIGALMLQSHRSLRDLYEVSCRELDDVVEMVTDVEGVYGARLTGGGFGGCAIALARPGTEATVRDKLRRHYDPHHARLAALYVTRPGAGARLTTERPAAGN